MLALTGAGPAWAADNDAEFSGASDAEAAAVTDEHFDSVLDDSSSTGLKLDRDEQIVGYRGTQTAVVSDGEDRSLLHSLLPLRADDEDGTPRRVSLDLEDHAGFVAPQNALADVRIGDTLAKGLSFPDIGVTFTPLGVDSSTRADVADGRSFYANANEAADLDFIVSPTMTGAETYDVLRSQDSPERLRYAAVLPLGAILERDPASPGSLRVVRGDQVLLTIAPVYASDADGRPIAAEYEITDAGFDITIKHRDTDAKYPILVDPSFWLDQRYWDQNGSISQKGWAFDQVYPSFGLYATTNGGIGARALQVWNGQTYYGVGGWGRWSFVSQGDSYISNGYLGRFAFIKNANNACIDGGLMRPDQNYGSGAYFGTCTGFGAQDVGFASQAADRTNRLAMRWVSGASAFYNSSSLAYLGGAAMVIQDDRAPVDLAVSGLPANNTWTATKPTSVTIAAKDNGVGLSKVSTKRSSDPTADTTTCPTGADSWNPQSGNIWCPMSLQTRSVPISVPEGSSSWTFSATDLVNNTASTPYTIKLDTTQPTLGTPAGNLWEARELDNDHRNEGHYNGLGSITISASDAGSGVKEVLVLRDGTQWGPSATYEPASQKYKWTEPSGGQVPDGRYKIEIVVRDKVWQSGSSTAASHELRGEPFYTTIDRAGDVVRADMWDGDPASLASNNDSTHWARPTANAARTEEGGSVLTQTDEACSTDQTGRCAALERINDDGPGGADPQYRKIIGSSADDHRISDHFLTARMPTGTATPAGTVTSILQPWQRRPPGSGAQATRYRASSTETIDGETVTVNDDVYTDSVTGLPLRIDHTEGTLPTESLYFHYDVDRKAVTAFAADFFDLVKPSTTSVDTETTLPAEEAEPAPPAPSAAEMLEHSLMTREALGLTTVQSTVQSIIDDLTSPVRDEALDLAGIPLTAAELDELKELVDAQSYTPELDSFAASNPTKYGGAFIDPATRRLVVKLTEVTPTLESALRALIPLGSDLVIQTVPMTLAALTGLQAQIEADADSGVLAAGSIGFTVRQSISKVVVTLSPDATLTEAALQQRYGAANVIAETEHGTGGLLSANEDIGRRAYAGRRILGTSENAGGETTCTTGGNVFTRAGRRRTFYGVTAAHCGFGFAPFAPPNGLDLEWRFGSGGRIGDAANGENLWRRPASEVTRDAATFRFTRSRLKSSKQFIRFATGVRGRYARITATGGVLEDGMACWTGATTLGNTGVSQCARIQDTNIKRKTPESTEGPRRTLRPLTKLQRGAPTCDNFNARYEGDSGASGFAKRRGSRRDIYQFGVLSFAFCDGRFPEDDSETFYFQQIDDALDELNVEPFCGRAGCDF